MMIGTRQKYIERIRRLFDSLPVKAFSDEQGVSVVTDTQEGSLRFYDDILSIESNRLSDGQTDFFLHYDLADEDEEGEEDLEEKVRPFLDFLKSGAATRSACLCKISLKRPMNVLLSCDGGVTSSWVASLMNEEAGKNGIDIHTEGLSWRQITPEKAAQFDLILIAPQIYHMEKRLRERFGCKVRRIDARDFATFNSKSILKKAMKQSLSGSCQKGSPGSGTLCTC